MNLQGKEKLGEALHSKAEVSSLAILVNYQGLTCENVVQLRKQLSPTGAKFQVVKNTIARRSIKETKAKGVLDYFVGPTAVIWSGTDPVAPAKVISDFAKGNEKLKIKAGVVDGSFLSATDVEALASMPSREQMLGKLLGLINAPATRLLQTINEPATQLVRLVAAWRDKLEK